MFHVLHILINVIHNHIISCAVISCCRNLLMYCSCAHIFGMCDDVSVRRNSRQTKISLKAVGHESRQVSLSQSEAMFKAPQPIRGTRPPGESSQARAQRAHNCRCWQYLVNAHDTE